ncbi:MAG: sulfurtransferase [Halobacteriaceae archaeon]
MTADALPGLVVSTEWLADHREAVAVVDVRDAWEYDGIGHVPGAVNVPFDAFRSADGDVGMLPGAVRWATLLGEAGIAADTPVVAYDDTHGVFAARFVVTALQYGHEEIALLDGDFSAWQRGHETSTAAPAVEPATYPVGDPVADFLVDVDAVASATADPDAVVVDTRDPAEYEAGHLPGAVNLDWLELVDQESRGLLPPETLRERLAAKGITPGRRVVLYCNTARRISHTYVVLRWLGFEDVAFFEGSLTEWLREDRPLEGTRADELTVDDVR